MNDRTFVVLVALLAIAASVTGSVGVDRYLLSSAGPSHATTIWNNHTAWDNRTLYQNSTRYETPRLANLTLVPFSIKITTWWNASQTGLFYTNTTLCSGAVSHPCLSAPFGSVGYLAFDVGGYSPNASVDYHTYLVCGPHFSNPTGFWSNRSENWTIGEVNGTWLGTGDSGVTQLGNSSNLCVGLSGTGASPAWATLLVLAPQVWDPSSPGQTALPITILECVSNSNSVYRAC